MTNDLTRETRDIIVLALDTLIEQLRTEVREGTYSGIVTKRLRAAVAARELVLAD